MVVVGSAELVVVGSAEVFVAKRKTETDRFVQGPKEGCGADEVLEEATSVSDEVLEEATSVSDVAISSLCGFRIKRSLFDGDDGDDDGDDDNDDDDGDDDDDDDDDNDGGVTRLVERPLESEIIFTGEDAAKHVQEAETNFFLI